MPDLRKWRGSKGRAEVGRALYKTGQHRLKRTFSAGDPLVVCGKFISKVTMEALARYHANEEDD